MIIADEGLNGNIVRELRSEGYHMEWIQEIAPGIPDEQVIQLVKERNQIPLTEDKDFGEWVHSHRVKGLTVIFLRYKKTDYPTIILFLKKLPAEILEFQSERENEFITINRNKVRRRKI